MPGLYGRYRNWVKSRKKASSAVRQAARMRDFYSQFIHKDELCFDVGANVGNRTEVFLALGARVVAVEPQDACAAMLEARFGGNPSVTVIRKALDSAETTRKLHIDNASTLSSMSPEWIERVKTSGRFAEHQWDHTVEITTTTLDNLVKQFGRPVFCKIDVEGFESNVLGGLTQPIRHISFEFVPEYLDSTRQCIEHLDGIGPVRFNYSEGESMKLAMDRWLSKQEFYPVIEGLPKDGKWFGDIYVEFDA